MTTRPRPLLRLLRITATFAAYALRYAARSGAALVTRRPSASILGETLASCLEACGPTFIKIGQILSTRHDLFERETVEGLARLQDAVSPAKHEDILAAIAEAFGKPPDELFAWIDVRPLASGSVAQVHCARTHDGRDVVVKVRRPGIVPLVAADLAMLRWVGHAIERSRLAGTVPVATILRELGETIMMQLDFHAEARHNAELRANLSHFPHLRMPAIDERLSRESVLTMERIDGLTRVDRTVLDPAERSEAAVNGLRLLYHMIFVDGLVHADLHPANIFFRRGCEVVLLDTGLMARLDDPMRKAFVDFFYGLVTNDGIDCARVIWETATVRGDDGDLRPFELHMCDIVRRHSALPASTFEVSRFVLEVFDAQRKARIRGSTAFMLAILSLLTYEGVVKTLSPGLDFQGEARHFLPAVKVLLYPRRPWNAA